MLYARRNYIKPVPERAYLERQQANATANPNEEMALLANNLKSVESIKASAARGMSRATMTKIWGARLVLAVLGHEDAV